MTQPRADSEASTRRRLLAFYAELHEQLGRGERPELASYVARFPECAEEVARAVLAVLAPADTQGDAELEGPSRLGPYVLGRERGRGGQAVVYEAEDARLRRTVALKVISGLGPGAESVLRRFRREAEVASRLDHPCICPVYDVGVEGGVAYIAMRLVDGETLAERLNRDRTQPQPASQDARRRGIELLTIFEKTARALHVAHEAGIVHRDVKPANIMIVQKGDPVLLDFGLAHAQDDGPTLTRTGDVFGTPAYMAPEQVSGRGPIDARTDVWGLGVSLFESFALRAPFTGATRQLLASAILDSDVPDIRTLAPAAPADLRTVISVALDKEPSRRYRSALELAEDLRRVREGEPPAARPVSLAGRWLRRARRRPVTALLIASLVLAVPILGVLAGIVIASRPAVEAARHEVKAAAVERELEIGHAALVERDLAGARAAFERAMDLDPESEDAVGGRALTDFVVHDAGAALARIRASPLLPRSQGLQLLVAASLAELGKADESAAVMRSLAGSSDPFYCFLDSYLTLQKATGGVGSPAARTAVALAWKAIAVCPKPRMIAFHHLAFAAASAGDESAARAAVAALRLHWPASARSEHAVGHALDRIDPPDARDAYRRAVAADPTWGMVWRDLVDLERRAGHLAAAVDAAEHACSAMPERTDNLSVLGELYALQGRFDEALVQMSLAAAREPKDARREHNRASVLRQAGRLREAEASYRKALELDPKWARSACDLAVTLRESGRYEDAVEMMKRGHELGTSPPGWSMPSARWVADASHLADRADALEEARRETDTLAELTHSELEDLSRLAVLAGYFRAAARFTEADMEQASSATGEGGRGGVRDVRRITGAGAAIRAAAGLGRDAPADASDRSALRSLALEWLSAAIETEREPSQAQDTESGTASLEILDHILMGVDLSHARGILRSDAIPSAERVRWATLFKECETLRDSLAARGLRAAEPRR